MRNTLLLTRSAIALSMVLVTTAPAAAESVIVTGSAQPTATVSTIDFNLGSSAGVSKLKARVKSVAAALCLTNAVEPVDIRIARTKCYRTAVSSGHRQIDRMVAAQSANSMRTAAAIRADPVDERHP